MNSKIIITLFGWLILFTLSVSAQEKESMESIWVFSDSIGIDFRGDEPKLFDVVTPDTVSYFDNDIPTASVYVNREILYVQIVRRHIFYPPDSSSPSSYYIEHKCCNILNKKNEVIINGDSLILNVSYAKPVFIPINDSLVYFFSVGNPMVRYNSDLRTGVPELLNLFYVPYFNQRVY